MHTNTNSRNDEDYKEKFGQSSEQGSTMGNENYKSQEMNREHSDNIGAGEHNYQQDETQYGKIRESEGGLGNMEERAENLRDKVNDDIHSAGAKANEYSGKAENKMHDWTDKAENKMNEWSDKAENKMSNFKDKVEDKMDNWTGKTDTERAEDKYEKADKKMDKAEKKMDKAQEKFAKGHENDGMRKMEKAEKKMDKADDKIQDAQEELGQNTGTFSSHTSLGNDNMEDYENRAGQGNPFENDNTNQGNVR